MTWTCLATLDRDAVTVTQYPDRRAQAYHTSTPVDLFFITEHEAMAEPNHPSRSYAGLQWS